MFCKNCGTQIEGDAKFCDNCGTQTAGEQANIKARQEKNLEENSAPYLDVKMAIIITVALFVILPIPCWLQGVPVALGFGTAGVLGAICVIQGVRNQRKDKK